MNKGEVLYSLKKSQLNFCHLANENIANWNILVGCSFKIKTNSTFCIVLNYEIIEDEVYESFLITIEKNLFNLYYLIKTDLATYFEWNFLKCNFNVKLPNKYLWFVMF